MQSWAIARFDLGLSDSDFGKLTPATFEALLDRKAESEKREYFRAGIVAAAIYNTCPYRGKDAKAVSPLDFVPGAQPEKRQSLAEQVKAMSAAFGCGPGKVGPRRRLSPTDRGRLVK